MSAAHLHLAINHIPVILVPVAAIILAYTLGKKSAHLTRAALVMLVTSAVFAGAAYLSGEPAEEAVEHLAHVSSAAVEEHEEFAVFGASASALAGVLAVVVLVMRRPDRPGSIGLMATLAAAVLASVLLGWTAYLGGQISHPELRANVGTSAD